jgi:hypothetical protein
MSQTTVTRGLSLFLAVSVLSSIGIFFYRVTPEPPPALLGRVDPVFALTCVVGVPLVDWLVAGLRM